MKQTRSESKLSGATQAQETLSEAFTQGINIDLDPCV
jgi:hypothetical protein